MAEITKVLLDTDVLIKAYRGDEVKIKNLNSLKGEYCISVITAIELIAGAKNFKQLLSLNKVLRIYKVYQIDESISQQTFKIYKQYVVKENLGLSDCFIAATALKHKFELYTDNKKDYNFIEGISLYKEK